jgi:hypothetical protein
MPANDAAVLSTSTDPKELMDAACRCAAGNNAADQALLLRYLGTEQFLARLDARDDYMGRPENLRLARVLRILMENEVPSARAMLNALTQKPAFVAIRPRQRLLVQALVFVRPAPPEAIAFWNAQSQPKSVYRHMTMDALADNGSPSAIALLENKLADPAHDKDEKIAWMRDPILRHRTGLPLLQACRRLLTTGLSPELRAPLVTALCDYRPELWYRNCDPPVPPQLARASKESKRELYDICVYAIDHVTLDPATRIAAEKTKKEVEPH